MLAVALTIVYVAVCVFLILVVLLQTGKRADLAGAFGGGGSQTAFGARGAATMLSKATTISAILFMILALALSILSSKRAGRQGSVLDDVAPESSSSAPAPETPFAPELPPAPLPEVPSGGPSEAPPPQQP